MVEFVAHSLHDLCECQRIHDHVMRPNEENGRLAVELRDDDELNQWTVHVELYCLLFAHQVAHLFIRGDALNNFDVGALVLFPFFIGQLLEPSQTKEVDDAVAHSTQIFGLVEYLLFERSDIIKLLE